MTAVARSRDLKVNVLVVDDEPEEAARYVETLNAHKDEAVREYWGAENESPINLHFRWLTPTGEDTVESFRNTFAGIVRCEEPAWLDFSVDLQIVIFDLFFVKPHWPVGGEELAKILRETRPNITRVLFSKLSLDHLVQERGSLFDLPASKSALDSKAGVMDFLRAILNQFSERNRTPFWSSLRDFSRTPKIVMHAMAGAQGRMAEVSVTTDRFLDFFGLAYLQVEGSSTARPLDSLLHPTNSMDGAQRQFAKSFGADYAFFVTNGTSTANKVVHAGLLSPGEIVCIDRNCHISHHYAMALTRAVPWYLEPFETEVPGISGGVPAERVADAIRTIISTTSSGTTARYARLPALIALTNCTFDGHICDPSRVFRSVVDVLQEFDISDRLYEIAFLFDEAWFSFGFFHPAFHKQTALGSAKNLSYEPASGRYWEQNLRVYVTQSLHKTGGAFRQASVVLVRDPKLYWAQERLAQTGCSSKVDLGLERRLHQAYLCHTSTSPSLPILASIDVARRQLDIEGVRLVESALKSARSFRAIASTPAKPGVGARLQDVFRPAEAEELIPENLRREFLLDPTKITLRSTRGVSGKSCRDLLWDCDAKIQVNKYASDSVLFMFMPGITDNWVGKLVQGMNRAAARMLETPLSGLTPHDSTDLSLPRSPFLETEFVDEHGRVFTYPTCLSANSGLDMSLCLFGTFAAFSEPLLITEDIVQMVNRKKKQYVSTDFITPYPPGYPIAVPGQVLTPELLAYLLHTEHGEVHGMEIDPRMRRTINAIDIERLRGLAPARP